MGADIMPQYLGWSSQDLHKLAGFRGLLDLAKSGLQATVLQLLHAHRATAKLGYIATSIFAGIMAEGFCTHLEEDRLPSQI